MGPYRPGKAHGLDNLAAIYNTRTDDPRDPVALLGRTGKGVLVSTVTRAHIERATDDERVHAIFDAFGPRNIVVVPLRGGEYVIVAAVSDTPRSLYEDDLECLRVTAAHDGGVPQAFGAGVGAADVAPSANRETR